MKEPVISVIVPVYKVEAYLPQCIDSILAQTYKKLEIVLVDDGSPDNCGEICDEYAEKDSRIKVIHQENKGLSAARNAGIDVALGKYLCFVDSDDMIHPDFVAALYDACVDTGADIALCRFSHEKSQVKRVYEPVKVIDRIAASISLCQDSTGAMAISCNKLYAHHLFKNIRFPEGRIHEDDATTYRLYWESRNVAIIEDVLYFYRVREGSIIQTGFSRRNLDAARAQKERTEFYESVKQQQLTDYSKASYCHFLRKHICKIRRLVPGDNYWEKEMFRSYIAVMRSDRIGIKKKLSLSLQMISPFVYQKLKSAAKHFESKQ